MTKTFPEKGKYDGLNLLGCAVNLILLTMGEVRSRIALQCTTAYILATSACLPTHSTHNHTLLLDQFWEDCGNTHLVKQAGKD